MGADAPGTAPAPSLPRLARTVAALALLLLFVWVAWSARSFRTGADLFPLVMGVAGALLCLVELGRQWITRHRMVTLSASTADLSIEAAEQTWAGWRRALSLFGWLLGWGLLTALLGLPLATLLWVPALLVQRFGARWRIALGVAAGLVALMGLLRTTLAMQWPAGWLALPF